MSSASSAPPSVAAGDVPRIAVSDLTIAYGSSVIQRDLDFTVRRSEIFVIMGGSGCGKTTLLRHMIGLMAPARGDVLYDGRSFWKAEPEERDRMMRRFGVLYQSGALWSSMTLAENIELVLESRDVIHAFYVPQFLFKRDVNPGMVNQFQFTIKPEDAGKTFNG